MIQKNLLEILGEFDLPEGDFSFEELDRGRIHETFVVTCRRQDAPPFRAVLQKLNLSVFPETDYQMHNFHLASRSLSEAGKPTLELIRTRKGGLYHRDREKRSCWRLTRYVENTKTFDETPDAQTAYEAGTLLGNYHETMASIPPGRLKPHARDFHSTPVYFQELKSTEKKADSSRFSDPVVREALEFIMDRKPLIHHLSRARESGVLADFVCHNDPKLNNMLFDARNGKGVCLIDLDTVDVGLLPTDFGDAVRSVCRRNIETPGAVAFDLDYFEAFCRGYFELMRGRIDYGTRSLLFDGVRVITLELSIRYLADFLDGGGYFKTEDPAETLLNALLQQKLLDALESSRERAGRILDSCFVD